MGHINLVKLECSGILHVEFHLLNNLSTFYMSGTFLLLRVVLVYCVNHSQCVFISEI